VTPAERDLVVAACARAAECWADGREDRAERWAAAAFGMVEQSGSTFLDEETNR
jgi:hypothetical protein